MDQYTIYLVNKGADDQTFWCFLERPQEIASDAEVFANSQAFVEVAPNYLGLNSFVIPVQYVVGAGATNQAVGLNVQVISTITSNANLADIWDADYKDAPPPRGPDLTKESSKTGDRMIAIKSNNFDKLKNENNHWFSNQSFGIMTAAGFMGMTWSPKAGQTRTLTPKLTFYVAIGNYGSNSLADWTTISNTAQAINVPTDFKYNECTVTYGGKGDWAVTKGKPPKVLAAAAEVRALASPDESGLAHGQVDILQSVHWESEPPGVQADFTFLTGTITVTQALTAAFTYFVLSGIVFTVNADARGQKTVRFSYSGDRGTNNIKSLFTAGVALVFH